MVEKGKQIWQVDDDVDVDMLDIRYIRQYIYSLDIRY